MGRWAQASRRGTVSAGQTAGGLGAPDPGDFEHDCSDDVRLFTYDGPHPPGTDGLYLQVSSDGGIDWDLFDAGALYSAFDVPGQPVVDDGCATGNSWRAAYSFESLPVGPFCAIQPLP